MLRAIIRRIWVENHHVYGPRKVWKQMGRENLRAARCRVRRLMREMGLAGAVRGRAWTITTQPSPDPDHPRDLVDRNFTATRPNQLWVSDVTYVATWCGFAYVAFVIDVFARRIVGWRVSSSLGTDFVLDALEQAIYDRCGSTTKGLVHHSDSKNILASCSWAALTLTAMDRAKLAPRGALGRLTRTPIDRQPCLSPDLSAAQGHLAVRLCLADACDPRRA